jgi:GlpG protein
MENDPGRSQAEYNSTLGPPQHNRPQIPILTTIACAICVAICLLINSGSQANFDDRLASVGYLPPERIWSGAVWGYITSAFVHVQIWHLAFNVYWLWILGGAVERHFGPRWWLLFFLAAAWISSGAEFLTGDTGLGMSGVGYALFGLTWISRSRIDEFRRIVSDQTAMIFLVWFVVCIFLDRTGEIAIGNLAHAGGLAFGVLVGFWVVGKVSKPALIGGIAVLMILSTVPIFGAPWSVNWTSHKAQQAMKADDYDKAIVWLRKTLEQGQDPKWTWYMLAQCYGYEWGESVDAGKPRYQAEYADALRRLRRLNPADANQVEGMYGKPVE